MEKVNLRSYATEALTTLFAELGHRPYRVRQFEKWLYQKGATEFEQMTDLAKPLRAQLAELGQLPGLTLVRESVATDQTRKYLFSLPDGETIEAVWIPDGKRATLCISSQVGCAMGCTFCLTAQGGLIRNLESWEIVEQLLAVRRLAPEYPPVTNMVMMGMGEPLANLDSVIPALERMADVHGIALAPRKTTVSTVGLVPKMRELGERAPWVNLAVSLGGATEAVREQLIPVANRWPLAEVMAACRAYPLAPRRSILFEYILIKGLNDSRADAKALIRQVHGVKCKVNLMAYNPSPGLPYQRPEEETVREFQRILCASGVRALVRNSRGQDILAACGQLRQEHDQEHDSPIELS